MSKKNKEVCRSANYIEHLFIVISTVAGCVSISAFASLVGIPEGITSSTVLLKTWLITTGIEKLRKRKISIHDKLVLLVEIR